MNIDDILLKRRIIITSGTGGVGKTTLSAALAMRAALLGRKTVVITIDPAKRLATSLGLGPLTDRPTDLTHLLDTALRKQKRSKAGRLGSLYAIVPDTRLTFENFLASITDSQAIIDRIVQNPIFEVFAKEFSGANEYMALERLYSLDDRGDPRIGKFDSIILDTPPSRNTLDFLDAPKLVSRFFDEKLINWLIVPTNKIVSVGMRKALEIMEKFTGAGFMTNFLDFSRAVFDIRLNFAANLKRITELMESEAVGFVMVTGPNPDSVPELAHFLDTLKSHQLHFDGLIVNRTLEYLKETSQESPGVQKDAAFGKALAIVNGLVAKEKRSLDDLRSRLPREAPCIILPELARDVHSIEDLLYVAMAFDRDAPMGTG